LILSGSIWLAIVLLLVAVSLLYVVQQYPEKENKITTNLNMMNTMLVGGLWHGASWNFMIWGGLNGLGIITYKFWKNWDLHLRSTILLLIVFVFAILFFSFNFPLLNIGFVWIGVLCVGTLILEYNPFKLSRKNFKRVETAWAIFQTFVFISFTRLFFRSGSNLDPAEANQTAWTTAKDMVNQIGGVWQFSQIGSIIYGYRHIFLMIIIGMTIHWLPDKLKRRYRILFAQQPLALMLVVVVFAVLIIYQFITADLQSFIYFQF
jgi:hypothetical protein